MPYLGLPKPTWPREYQLRFCVQVGSALSREGRAVVQLGKRLSCMKNGNQTGDLWVSAVTAGGSFHAPADATLHV